MFFFQRIHAYVTAGRREGGRGEDNAVQVGPRAQEVSNKRTYTTPPLSTDPK